MADATTDPQSHLAFGPVRNSGLFSNHWLEHRLPLEPEWDALRDEARTALDALADLWREQRDLGPQYGDEQGLEQAFIQPALAALGWKLKYQTFLRGDKPDYALFLSQADLRDTIARDRTADDWWQKVAVVADAKAWHVRLDQRRGSGAKREFPPEQIERYLVRSGLDYGVLTNGRSWRLFPRTFDPGQRRYETYLEADLPAILDAWISATEAGGGLFDPGGAFDDFLRFYLFFSPAGFREAEGRPPLVRRARLGSGEYRLGVGEGLKDRIFEALRLCIDGFLRHAPNGLSPADDLQAARDAGFVLLYRLLFVLYAEDRGLLPYRRHRTYTDNRSLGRFRDDVAAESRSGFARLDPAATGYWADLKALFALIDDGGARYGVPAYNGGLFDPDRHPFLEANALPDPVVARVIDQLGRAPDPQRPDLGLFRVDYRDLAIQHLGSVYEGMLELRPRVAGVAMRVVRKKQRRRKPAARYLPPAERTIKAGAAVPAGFERTNTVYEVGDVYLETDKGERRATGSYYTPQHVVDHILDKTLGPLFDAIHDAIAADPDRLAGTFDDRVLDLRVLDPAMGSGHFLLGACQYAAEQIATSPFTADAEADALSGDESTLAYWKRRVVERCLYGVDKNPLAVELAKLALWLETVAEGRPLSFLDHHLRHGDSLVGATVAELAAPPGAPDAGDDLFVGIVRKQLPAMLSALSEIRTIRSESRDEIKQKEKLFRDGLQRRREPFLAVADLWASTFLLPDGPTVDGERRPLTRNLYQAALDALPTPAGLSAVLVGTPYAQHLAVARRPEHRALHWELEFPECFFTLAGGRRPDAGFDAIIGNPPYDVLSEKETGLDLGPLKRFIDHHAAGDAGLYAPSKVGKNNLYKLFVCRAWSLLRDGGRLGFITPMALLGDMQSAGLRRLIMSDGRFSGVQSFPQKDDVENRVFFEAKLSTAIVVAERSPQTDADDAVFTNQVNPGREIIDGSPSLKLSADKIRLYDPVNLSIVSCSEEDWTLATRMATGGRTVRFGTVAAFYQGEVNETNERARLNLIGDGTAGDRIIRGSEVSLYQLRPPSQGEAVFLNVERFLDGKAEGSKAFDHRLDRVAWQNLSAQNNFRRLIACRIPAGYFCNHALSYCPSSGFAYDLDVFVAFFNSKLADWHYRLGSTNNNTMQYLLEGLPFPAFADAPADGALGERAAALLTAGRPADVDAVLAPALIAPPFDRAVLETLAAAARKIAAIEHARGPIARRARSKLDPKAQPYQNLIDRLLYRCAGLSDAESAGLERRLAEML